jgi:hypothetical protein
MEDGSDNESEPTEPRTVTYVVDAGDTLCDVDDAWSTFAELNDAGGSLRPKDVIGRSLWDFIRDESLQIIYRRLLDLARSSSHEIEFDFRCDSPSFRRYMHMRMKGRDDGHVLFVSQTLRTAASHNSLRSDSAYKGNRHVRRCSLCNQYAMPDGSYGEIEQLVTDDGLLDNNSDVRIIWTVCENCHNTMGSVQ